MKTKIYKIEIFFAETEHISTMDIYKELQAMKAEVPEILRLNAVEIGSYHTDSAEATHEIEYMLNQATTHGGISTAQAREEYNIALDQDRDFA